MLTQENYVESVSLENRDRLFSNEEYICNEATERLLRNSGIAFDLSTNLTRMQFVYMHEKQSVVYFGYWHSAMLKQRISLWCLYKTNRRKSGECVFHV